MEKLYALMWWHYGTTKAGTEAERAIAYPRQPGVPMPTFMDSESGCKARGPAKTHLIVRMIRGRMPPGPQNVAGQHIFCIQSGWRAMLQEKGETDLSEPPNCKSRAGLSGVIYIRTLGASIKKLFDS